MIKLFTWRSKVRRLGRLGQKEYPFWAKHPGQAAGVLFNPHALWLGLHYSPGQKRYCLNIVPFITLWFAPDGGLEP